jgi:5-methylcytosine-specific restriction endonuclease McrA
MSIVTRIKKYRSIWKTRKVHGYPWRFLWDRAMREEMRAKRRNRKDHVAHVRKYGKSFLRNKKLIKERLMERDGDWCQLCGATEALTIDHKRQVNDGGTNHYENLRLLCLSCHRKKDGHEPKTI